MSAQDFLSEVSEPLRVSSASELAWDDSADVIVVGFGGAGAATALEARDHGADVLVIDRFGGGGATGFSGGIVYAGGTRYQKEAGVMDSADNMFDYLTQEESAVSRETLRAFCDGSSADMDWLASKGLLFGGAAYGEKTPYPPEPYCLYYSGNEKVPSYTKTARPAQRGHRTHGRGMTGYAYYNALRAAVERAGARLKLHSPVRRLVIDAHGAVIGVEALAIPKERWVAHDAIYRKLDPVRPFSARRNEKAAREGVIFERQFQSRILIRARSGVVLATGGFINNLDMLREYRKPYADAYPALMRIGSMGCDGSGIDLGRSVGGETGLMDRIYAGGSVTPPASFLGGILVDDQGRRVVNEDAYAGFIGDAIGRLPGMRAWLIVDRTLYRQAILECVSAPKGLRLWSWSALLNILIGGTKRAPSLQSLAAKCGFDPRQLEASITENNVAASGASSDPVGKAAYNVRPIATAPYYAVNLASSNKFTITMCFTLGGLKVDEQSGAVQRPDGTVVAGLFAAGRVAVGLCSKGYLSGMSLADTVFSGRRAARSLTARAGSSATAD